MTIFKLEKRSKTTGFDRFRSLRQIAIQTRNYPFWYNDLDGHRG